MINVYEYIERKLAEQRIFDEINITLTKDGYGTAITVTNGDLPRRYMIYICKEKLRWYNFFHKLAVRHEIGHVIAQNKIDAGTFDKPLHEIQSHSFFRTMQITWYWNPLLRWIKRMLGFSLSIDYKKEDDYDETKYTHMDVEMFCDWYALFGE